jgi:hypothetical protein
MDLLGPLDPDTAKMQPVCIKNFKLLNFVYDSL